MPSAFTGELRLTSLDADCRVWRLDEPLTYEVGALGSGLMIEVPAGFVTDGASIPPPLRGLLPPWGRYSRAAIVHDYLLRVLAERGAIDPHGCLSIAFAGWHMAGIPDADIPTLNQDARRWADHIFHEAMIAAGVPRPLAALLWAGVRIGSRFPVLRNWADATD